MVVGLRTRVFNVSEYHQMIQTGVLAEDERVELLGGEIVTMNPIGSHHAACVNRLNRVLSQSVGQDVIILVQNPIYLEEYSEPQPDVALVRFREDYYANAHPKAQEVLLVIEVMERPAEYDRAVKLPLYSKARIAEVWLVELSEKHVEVFRHPTENGYKDVVLYHPGSVLSPVKLSGLRLAVDKIFGLESLD